MTTVKIPVSFVSSKVESFGDGGSRERLSVVYDGGDVVDVWGTNDAAESLKALGTVPMGTTLTLEFEVRVKRRNQGNPFIGLHLIGATREGAKAA